MRLLLIALCLASTGAVSAARAMVHGVVPPAWIERGGRVLPLKPEALVLEGDVLRTGRGGRVEVDLPDGSAVKLGAGATLGLDRARMAPAAAGGDLFESTLDLVKGAFRFTTHALGASRKRDVRIKVGVVTVGVRGTDLVIVADEQGDRIMLVEGRIELAGQMMAAPMMMERAMDYMVIGRDGLMQQPAMSHDGSMAMMGEMDAMTGMAAGSGMLMMDAAMGGRPPEWDVVVMSLREPANAARVARELEAAGWPVEVLPAQAGGFAVQRVAIPGFHSVGEARAFAARVEGERGLRGAWLLRHRVSD